MERLPTNGRLPNCATFRPARKASPMASPSTAMAASTSPRSRECRCSIAAGNISGPSRLRASRQMLLSADRTRARSTSRRARGFTSFLCWRREWNAWANKWSGGDRQGRARVGLDTLDHRLEAVRTLRREVFAQAKLVEQRDCVALEDLARVFAGVEGEQDGDEPAYDVGVAVACEGEHRSARAVRLDAGREPHLAGAALHLIGLGARGLGQRRKLAAEFDYVTVAVVPIVEDGEIVDDVVDRHGVRPRPRYRHARCRGRGRDA